MQVTIFILLKLCFTYLLIKLVIPIFLLARDFMHLAVCLVMFLIVIMNINSNLLVTSYHAVINLSELGQGYFILGCLYKVQNYKTVIIACFQINFMNYLFKKLYCWFYALRKYLVNLS